jgi:hypothetical protein
MEGTKPIKTIASHTRNKGACALTYRAVITTTMQERATMV